MGGNPRGNRSQANGMILLCPSRHRQARISLDRCGLRIVPLTDLGTDGPCVFHINTAAVAGLGGPANWVVLAIETTPGVFGFIDNTLSPVSMR
jgi:hypothetical protein